ncbi:thioredoxin [Clostridia bacterium]|nr:thioredoxin [Clostridia bacterium]
MIQTLDNGNFEETIQSSKTPIIIDFYADWCGPCKMMTPMLEELAQENSGKVSFYKVNVDENPEIASRYSVSNIPTFASFVDGKHIRSSVGARPRDEIMGLIG